MWVVSLALLPALGLSYLYLYEDGVRGYPDVLPIYLFGGVAVVCTLFWAFMAARVLRR